MSVTTENSQYKTPRIYVMEVAVSGILCQSGKNTNGNEWWREEDLGDGGFH